jgi:hypothetical protein
LEKLGSDSLKNTRTRTNFETLEISSYMYFDLENKIVCNTLGISIKFDVNPSMEQIMSPSPI